MNHSCENTSLQNVSVENLQFHLNGGEPVSAHPTPSGRLIYLTFLLIFR